MQRFRLSPQTRKQWRRFRSIKRGYYSLLVIAALLVATLFAELWVNSRALIVKYDGSYYFPTYGAYIAGDTFGLDYQYETNYRELAAQFAAARAAADEAGSRTRDDWVLMPLVPYNAFETDFRADSFPPYPPRSSTQHYLGTDTTGRDIVARLVYGFRLAMAFALILLTCNYIVGVTLGGAMGYVGRWFDLAFQRLIEVWSNVPFLYVIMIIASVIVPNFWTLVAAMVLFGWMEMTWYMRTSTYREKVREYVVAARALGASAPRILLRHILPNSISIIVTFVPFSVASGVTALTALDYLGFGLPPPTPSWGELLAQGTANLQYPWIVTSVVVAMTVVLLMVAFIGEAIREAFDPKQFTYYE